MRRNAARLGLASGFAPRALHAVLMGAVACIGSALPGPVAVAAEAAPPECGPVELPVVAPGATYDVKAMGAVADGRPHPLSERYRTLGDAQADYPAARSLDQLIDAEALRKAVILARTAGRGRVYLPAGNYVVDKGPSAYDRAAVQLDGATNLIFEGDGPDRSTITLAAMTDIVNAKNSSNLVFRNLKLHGSRLSITFSDAQYHGLFFVNTRNVLVENVTFSEFRGDGIRTISDDPVSWTENLTVTNSLFINNGRAGASHQRGSRRLCYLRNRFEGQASGPDLAFEATGKTRRQENDIWIVGNVMRRTAGDISISPQGGDNVMGYGLSNSTGFHVLHNRIDGGSVLIRNIDASEFSGNTVRGSGRVPALDIGYVNDLVVSGNTLETASGKPVIRLRARETVNRLSITGNQLTQRSDGNEAHGIWAKDFAGSFMTISGNTLSGSGGGSGIRLDRISGGAPSQRLEVSLNTIANFSQGLIAGIRKSATKYGDVNISGNTFNDDRAAPTQKTGIILGTGGSSFAADRLSLTDNRFGGAVEKPATVDSPSYFLAELEAAGCDASQGGIRGWVYVHGGGKDVPSVAILVDSDTQTATVSATAPRPDIDARYGVTGARGFSIAAPATIRDGAVHRVRLGALIAGGVIPSRAMRDLLCPPATR
ncbi:MAG TPA: right-handed parallel beta-helix repeat-containing protein [Solimonas sp.]|nr:right-handed parallel beta-helix repeat-containing protein [Solimonas sp.]